MESQSGNCLIGILVTNFASDVTTRGYPPGPSSSGAEKSPLRSFAERESESESDATKADWWKSQVPLALRNAFTNDSIV